jgi:hypothetical protein
LLRRLAIAGACLALPVAASWGLLFSTSLVEKAERQQPGIHELSQLLHARSGWKLFRSVEQGVPDERQIAIYISSRYGDLITDANTWQSMYARSMISGAKRKFAEESVSRHPDPSDEEIEEAAAAVEPITGAMSSSNPMNQRWFPLVVFGSTLVIYVALPALLAALLFRGGVVMRALRVAVVLREGTPASRWRVAYRGLFTWGPVVLWPLAAVFLSRVAGDLWAAVLLVGFGLAVLFISVMLPERSLQDRLAGTQLVPR